jgi:hypothetical protein
VWAQDQQLLLLPTRCCLRTSQGAESVQEAGREAGGGGVGGRALGHGGRLGRVVRADHLEPLQTVERRLLLQHLHSVQHLVNPELCSSINHDK